MCAIQQSAALIAEWVEFSTSLALRHNSCSWHGMWWVCLKEVWRLKGCQRLTSHQEPPTHACAHLRIDKHTNGYMHMTQSHGGLFALHLIIHNVNDTPEHHRNTLYRHSTANPWSNWFREESAALKKKKIQHIVYIHTSHSSSQLAIIMSC